jgi:hypothetical protein
MVKIAKPVASALEVPLVGLVWDPPGYVLGTLFHFDKFSLRSLLGQFAETMRSAQACGVMSPAMQNEFRSKYGVQTTILRHSISQRLWRTSVRRHDSDSLIIGFAGSTYTPSEWEALFAALNTIHWRFDGRSVRIRILASHFVFKSKCAAHVEYFGWRPIEEVIALLSEADILYLPYRFDSGFEEAAQMGFPTKLSTYLAAGVPVLYHGPQEASVTHFMREYPVGACCHSQDSMAILDALSAVLESQFQQQFSKVQQRALASEFSDEVFRRRFADLIGVDNRDFLPTSGQSTS